MAGRGKGGAWDKAEVKSTCIRGRSEVPSNVSPGPEYLLSTPWLLNQSHYNTKHPLPRLRPPTKPTRYPSSP
jgi:hypothetical protein